MSQQAAIKEFSCLQGEHKYKLCKSRKQITNESNFINEGQTTKITYIK